MIKFIIYLFDSAIILNFSCILKLFSICSFESGKYINEWKNKWLIEPLLLKYIWNSNELIEIVTK